MSLYEARISPQRKYHQNPELSNTAIMSEWYINGQLVPNNQVVRRHSIYTVRFPLLLFLPPVLIFSSHGRASPPQVALTSKANLPIPLSAQAGVGTLSMPTMADGTIGTVTCRAMVSLMGTGGSVLAVIRRDGIAIGRFLAALEVGHV